MDRNALRTCSLLGLALAASLGLAIAAEEPSVGYLAKFGPAAMRFQKLAPQTLTNLPPLPMDDVKVANPSVQLASLAGTPLFPIISPIPTPETWISPAVNSQAGPPGALNPYNQLPPPGNAATNTAAYSPTANDLLGVNPQMLVEYFKPSKGSTNGAGVSVMMPVPFTPATPAASPSSASYRDQ